jgi:hypothetical protein
MLFSEIIIISQYKHVEIEIIHISVVYSPNIANKQHQIIKIYQSQCLIHNC